MDCNEMPEPTDELERGLIKFVEENNNFHGDDVRAILQRVHRLRGLSARATAFEERFRRHLEAALQDPRDAREFPRLLNLGMEYFGLTDEEMAGLVGASRPAVTRWRAGAACPHLAMRRPTYRALLHKLRERPPSVSLGELCPRCHGTFVDANGEACVECPERR